MTRKKTNPAITIEEENVEPEQLVASVTEVIPESPAEETVPADEEMPKVDEESTAESVVSDIAEGMVKVLVVLGTVGFKDGEGFKGGTFQKGETFVVTRERAESLHQKFIKIL